jgi:NDP-sugar pyrophosphorylase family protein
MFCGISICQAAVLDLPVPAPPFSLMADLFAPALAAGSRLAGYLHRGYFRTVDDLASYDELCREFAVSPPRLAYLG